MSIKSKARRCGIARAISSLSNTAVDVHGQRKIASYGLPRYISKQLCQLTNINSETYKLVILQLFENIAASDIIEFKP